jgi:prolyl oligopeptidase PreP (S9A serine peptidase family)
MKVALPAVGVMDMLRYHTFTAGAGWAYDYGTSADSKEMFENIYKYSPVQNVKEGIKYPATLLQQATTTTGLFLHIHSNLPHNCRQNRQEPIRYL